ncbi:hypothetical protein [Qipengyuania sp. 483]
MDQEDLIDATAIVSLRFVSETGEERFETYTGRIAAFQPSDKYESLEDGSSTDVMLFECHDGEVRKYPFDPSVFEPANPGFYELNDGATIENPDYIIEWRVTEPVKH